MAIDRAQAGGGMVTPLQNANLSGGRQDPSAGIQTGGPEDWFGPGNPMRPTAPPEVAGRTLDFPVAYNLAQRPRAYEPISFETLRNLANASDILRTVIETRKDQIAGLEWKIVPRDPENKPEKNPATKARVEALMEIFREPYPGIEWADWIRMLLEDLFVIDAPTIYPRPNRGGGVYGFKPIDGATVKRIIDDWGDTPIEPGQPAYQQVLKGLPAVNYTADQLIYRPRNRRTSKVYGYCYDAATEILTRARGWVNFADLAEGEEVATRSDAGEFEWQIPSRIVREDWDDEMIHFTSKSMDILVTPEHRMLVDTLPRALGGGRNRAAGEVVITADDYARHGNSMVKIPALSWWSGQEVGDRLFSKVHCQPLGMTGDDYCALMGAFLAQGNMRSQGGIEVSQRRDGPGFGLYQALFERLGGGHNGRAFTLPRRAITDHFRSFGLSHEKFIPDEVMNATPRQLKIFWDHYVGGHHSPRPNASGRGSQPDKAERITTASRSMADQFVEVAQKLGMSASIYVRKGRPTSFLGGQYMSECRDAYVVSCRYSPANGVKAKRTHYTGKIYCVTVPNGIVYVRRNGKPAWSGNSPVEQIIAIVNISLRRETWQLEFFTHGTLPDALIGTPSEWTPDQIRNFQDWFDARLMGNTGGRRGATFVPGDMSKGVYQTKETELFGKAEEWLARVICFAFGISPQPFVQAMNRATAETAQDTASAEGLGPTKQWVKGLIDSILRKYLKSADMQLVWVEEEALDPKEQSEIVVNETKVGLMTLDEGRKILGRDPTGIPETSRPMVLTATGWVPIAVEDAMAEAKDKAALIAPPGGESGPPGENDDEEDAKPPASSSKALGHFNGDEYRFGKLAIDVSPDRALVRREAGVIRKSVSAMFADAAVDVAAQVTAALDAASKMTKADDPVDGAQVNDDAITPIDTKAPEVNVTTLVNNLDLSSFDVIVDAVEESLFDVASDTALKALAQIGVKAKSQLVDQVNDEAVSYARNRAAELVGKRFLADGSLIDNPNAKWAITETTRTMLRETIAKGLEDNIGTPAIAKQIEESYTFSAERAKLVANTEVANANEQSKLIGWRRGEEAGVTVKKKWLLGPNSCEICKKNAAQGAIPLDEDFVSGDESPLAHPNCLPGDMRVVPAGDLQAATRRHYDGDLVIIRTAGGNHLSCTPNHPILTDGGWVAAGLLDVGSHVISHSGRQGMAAGDLNANDVPTAIHEVAEAFGRASKVFAAEVEVSAPDFHGDGVDGQVAVVWSERLLRDDVETPGVQQGGQVTFAGAVESSGGLGGDCGKDLRAGDVVRPFDGGVSSGDLGYTLLGSHVDPAKSASVRNAPDGDARLLQPDTNRCAAHVEPLRDGKLRHASDVGGDYLGVVSERLGAGRNAASLQFTMQDGHSDAAALLDILQGEAGLVEIDRVIEIERISFSGHVYNLQTAMGWYVAEGIVTHNCTCVSVPEVDLNLI